MKVSELMNPAGVRLYANIKEAADVLGILVELQEETGAITNGTAYYNAVCQRENFGGTTAIGDGIALPHACNAGVSAPRRCATAWIGVPRTPGRWIFCS